MSVAVEIREPRMVLYNVSWQSYVALRDAPENSHLRMTYDRGRLVLMSPTGTHERIARLIARLIIAWSEVFGIALGSRGTTTWRREDLARGLEPDNCFYLENESVVRDKDELDLTLDPPPDLAIEVDVTSSSLDKLEVYAALKVPEVWRWWDDALQVYRLLPHGAYERRDASEALPGFPLELAAELISQRFERAENDLVRRFRREIKKLKLHGESDANS